MLKFRGLLIPGTGSAVSFGSPRGSVKRVHHWGTRGDTEIRGKVGGRELRAVMWLHDPSWLSSAKVYAFLDKLTKQINEHGELQLLDRNKKVIAKYPNVTFDEWQPGGQTQDGLPMVPIPDIARTLEPDIGETKNAWWIEVNLRFYQLYVPPKQYVAP